MWQITQHTLPIRQTLFAMFVLLSASCNLNLGETTEPIPVKGLVFPPTEYYDSLISKGDDIVVLVDNDMGDLQWYAKEGDKDFATFTFTENTGCSSTKRYGSYETLPDGRLQVWKWCLTEKGGVDYLLAYDWETHQLEKIVGPLPLGSSGASWNPEQTKAIGYLDSKFATKTLYWIYPNRFEPLDLEIKDGNRSWNLKDDFPEFTADDTGKSGTTGRTSWSPDGKSIAFFASPNAIGKTGFDRFGVEHYLYLMNPETLQYEVVADSIYSPFLLAWSPDSTQIVFLGRHGLLKEKGIWLYSVETRSITEISEGDFKSIVWKADGKSLVAVQCEDFDLCNKILEYDLTGILE